MKSNKLSSFAVPAWYLMPFFFIFFMSTAIYFKDKDYDVGLVFVLLSVLTGFLCKCPCPKD